MSDQKTQRGRRKLALKRALELMNEKSYSKAMECYDMCVGEDPNNFGLYVNRSFCAQQLGLLAKALADAKTAIELNPNHISGHYRKGCVHLAAKLFRSAEESFQRALQIDAEDVSTRRKIKETHRLFLKEFGFEEKEIEDCVQRYETCAEITDDLISGRIMRVIATNWESMVSSDISCETGRRVVDDLSNSLSDISIDTRSLPASEDQLNGDFIPIHNTSPRESDSMNGECDGIRLPKSVPFVARKSLDTSVGKTVEAVAEPQNEPKKSTPKMVKTRPQIRLCAK